MKKQFTTKTIDRNTGREIKRVLLEPRPQVMPFDDVPVPLVQGRADHR